ncbi:MAG: PQQ-dependent sugar dehydrogenase [Chloroflexota bacterium]
MNTNRKIGIYALLIITLVLGSCSDPAVEFPESTPISDAAPGETAAADPKETADDVPGETEDIIPEETEAPFSWPGIKLHPITEGLENPVHITHAGDGNGRIYVVEQAGRIRIIQGGALLGTPLLDISDRVWHKGEQGLLSAAFPPGYPEVGHFYVYYTNLAGDNLVARFSLLPGVDDQADPASELLTIYFEHPEKRNHNGGQIAFGPDNYLYIGTGDGGGANDPYENGQNPGTLLGKILRIDVESGVTPYAIPGDNPFVGKEGYRDEIWALGLRNPWRFSFDRESGDLYIADVGQKDYEEVNVQPAGSPGGENYGWNIMEGNHCFKALLCDQNGLTAPAAEYSHKGGNCSITGGVVYRGSAYPALEGIYFLSDFCSRQIWGLKALEGNWVLAPLLGSDQVIATFGEDGAGEVYLADYITGVLYQIIY